MNPITAFKAYRAYARLRDAWKEWSVKKEPVAIGMVIRSAAVLLAVFGLEVTPEQLGGVIVTVELVLGLWTRSRVSPVPK